MSHAMPATQPFFSVVVFLLVSSLRAHRGDDEAEVVASSAQKRVENVSLVQVSAGTSLKSRVMVTSATIISDCNLDRFPHDANATVEWMQHCVKTLRTFYDQARENGRISTEENQQYAEDVQLIRGILTELRSRIEDHDSSFQVYRSQERGVADQLQEKLEDVDKTMRQIALLDSKETEEDVEHSPNDKGNSWQATTQRLLAAERPKVDAKDNNDGLFRSALVIPHGEVLEHRPAFHPESALRPPRAQARWKSSEVQSHHSLLSSSSMTVMEAPDDRQMETLPAHEKPHQQELSPNEKKALRELPPQPSGVLQQDLFQSDLLKIDEEAHTREDGSQKDRIADQVVGSPASKDLAPLPMGHEEDSARAEVMSIWKGIAGADEAMPIDGRM